MKKKIANTSAAPAASPAPENTPAEILDGINRLLSAKDEIVGEVGKYQRELEGLDEAEEKLLANTDLSNRRDFKKVSDLRLKRELLPRKLESLNADAGRNWAAMREKLYLLRDALAEKIWRKKTAALDELGEAVQPFFTGRPFEARAAAEQILGETNFGQAIRDADTYLSSAEFARGTELRAVMRLARIAKLAELVKPYMEFLGEQTEPVKSADDVEREELRDMLQSVEPFIQSKMRYGISRKAAESAVAARKKLLLSKYPAT